MNETMGKGALTTVESVGIYLSNLVPFQIGVMATSAFAGASDSDWDFLRSYQARWWEGAPIPYTKNQWEPMMDAWIGGIDADTTPLERRKISQMRAELLRVIATMAWAPGGVQFCGWHFVAPIIWVQTYDGQHRHSWAKTFPFGWCVKGTVPKHEYYLQPQLLKPLELKRRKGRGRYGH